MRTVNRFSWAALGTVCHNHWVLTTDGTNTCIFELLVGLLGCWERAQHCSPTGEGRAPSCKSLAHVQGTLPSVTCSRVPPQWPEGVLALPLLPVDLPTSWPQPGIEPRTSHFWAQNNNDNNNYGSNTNNNLCTHRLATCFRRGGDDQRVPARGVKNVMGLYPQIKSTELQGIHLFKNKNVTTNYSTLCDKLFYTISQAVAYCRINISNKWNMNKT